MTQEDEKLAKQSKLKFLYLFINLFIDIIVFFIGLFGLPWLWLVNCIYFIDIIRSNQATNELKKCILYIFPFLFIYLYLYLFIFIYFYRVLSFFSW